MESFLLQASHLNIILDKKKFLTGTLINPNKTAILPSRTEVDSSRSFWAQGCEKVKKKYSEENFRCLESLAAI